MEVKIQALWSSAMRYDDPDATELVVFFPFFFLPSILCVTLDLSAASFSKVLWIYDGYISRIVSCILPINKMITCVQTRNYHNAT